MKRRGAEENEDETCSALLSPFSGIATRVDHPL